VKLFAASSFRLDIFDSSCPQHRHSPAAATEFRFQAPHEPSACRAPPRADAIFLKQRPFIARAAARSGVSPDAARLRRFLPSRCRRRCFCRAAACEYGSRRFLLVLLLPPYARKEPPSFAPLNSMPVAAISMPRRAFSSSHAHASNAEGPLSDGILILLVSCTY